MCRMTSVSISERAEVSSDCGWTQQVTCVIAFGRDRTPVTIRRLAAVDRFRVSPPPPIFLVHGIA